MPAHRVPARDRFWSKVERGGPDECWPWLAARSRAGYGMFSGDDRRTTSAQRMAWALSRGGLEPPAGRVVMHTCDNPPCCNPGHLVLGTHGDNMADKIAKGRAGAATRDQLPQTKISVADTKDMLTLYRAGQTQATIAATYGVARATVSRALAAAREEHHDQVAP